MIVDHRFVVKSTLADLFNYLSALVRITFLACYFPCGLLCNLTGICIIAHRHSFVAIPKNSVSLLLNIKIPKSFKVDLVWRKLE